MLDDVAEDIAACEELILRRDEAVFEWQSLVKKALRFQPWSSIVANAAADGDADDNGDEGGNGGNVDGDGNALEGGDDDKYGRSGEGGGDAAVVPYHVEGAVLDSSGRPVLDAHGRVTEVGTGFAIWDCSVALGWLLEHLTKLQHTQSVYGQVQPDARALLEALSLPALLPGSVDYPAAYQVPHSLLSSAAEAEAPPRRCLVPLRGVRAFELGSGNGVAGIAAAALGASVTLSDEPHVLDQLRRNAQLNMDAIVSAGGRADVTRCVWEECVRSAEAMPFELEHCDLLLGADLLYRASDESQLDTLCALLRKAMAPGPGRPEGARLLYAHKCRHDALDHQLRRKFREVARVELTEIDAQATGFRPPARFHLGRADRIRYFVGTPIVRPRLSL